MTAELTYERLLATKGVSLHQLGLREIALHRADALTAVEILHQQSIPILGGDVYFVLKDRTEPAYASWHCDPRAGERVVDYIARSCDDARKYIVAFPYRDTVTPVFVIVI
jgi:hypothetical protein